MRQILIVVLTISLFIVSCNSDDGPMGGQDILVSDTSLSTGRLVIEVLDVNSTPQANKEVTLHATYEDLQNNIWIYYLTTDNRGEANFGFINIGNYYIYASDPAQSGAQSRNNDPGDVAQVRSQKTTERRVIIR
jgi:hypothetical protein